MKRSSLLMVAAVGFALLAGRFVIAAAEDTNGPAKAAKPPVRAFSPYALQVERLGYGLNLTPEQKAKFCDLLATNSVRTRDLNATPGLPVDQKRQQAFQIRQEYLDGVKSILTTNQFDLWQKRQGPAGKVRPNPTAPPKKAEAPKAT